MSDAANLPDSTPSGANLVTAQEPPLILKSQTLPHGVGVDTFTMATLDGYDTARQPRVTDARPDWSGEYSASMRALVEAGKHQPPEVLHAADYVLEQVAKMTGYDEQRIIQARQQIAQDLNDGSFARKVEAARGLVETLLVQQPPLER